MMCVLAHLYGHKRVQICGVSTPLFVLNELIKTFLVLLVLNKLLFYTLFMVSFIFLSTPQCVAFCYDMLVNSPIEHYSIVFHFIDLFYLPIYFVYRTEMLILVKGRSH